MRSAGSHGAADLVGIGPAGIMLLQVKAGVNPPTPGELREAFAGLGEIAAPDNARREVWHWSTPQRMWHRHALPDRRNGLKER